jgi:ADP-ribose pyrophosphatase YjhB (NUDIX family)
MIQAIWKPHVTVASVIEREGRFLLVEEQTESGIALNQPAGHLENGESLLQAVVRETLEETAWRFTPAGLIGIYRWRIADTDKTYLRYCFYGQCRDHQPERALDEGIIGVRWLTRDALLRDGRMRSPLVMRGIDDYLSGRRYPLEILIDC